MPIGWGRQIPKKKKKKPQMGFGQPAVESAPVGTMTPEMQKKPRRMIDMAAGFKRTPQLKGGTRPQFPQFGPGGDQRGYKGGGGGPGRPGQTTPIGTGYRGEQPSPQDPRLEQLRNQIQESGGGNVAFGEPFGGGAGMGGVFQRQMTREEWNATPTLMARGPEDTYENYVKQQQEQAAERQKAIEASGAMSFEDFKNSDQMQNIRSSPEQQYQWYLSKQVSGDQAAGGTPILKDPDVDIAVGDPTGEGGNIPRDYDLDPTGGVHGKGDKTRTRVESDLSDLEVMYPPQTEYEDTMREFEEQYREDRETQDWGQADAELDRLVQGGGGPGPSEKLDVAKDVIAEGPTKDWKPQTDIAGTVTGGEPFGGEQPPAATTTTPTVTEPTIANTKGEGPFPFSGIPLAERQAMAEKEAAYTGRTAEQILKEWDAAEAKYNNVVDPNAGPNIGQPPPENAQGAAGGEATTPGTKKITPEGTTNLYGEPYADGGTTGGGGTTETTQDRTREPEGQRASGAADTLLDRVTGAKESGPVGTHEADVFGGQYEKLANLGGTASQRLLEASSSMAGGGAEQNPVVQEQIRKIQELYAQRAKDAEKRGMEIGGELMGARSTPTAQRMMEEGGRERLAGAEAEAGVRAGAIESVLAREQQAKETGVRGLEAAASTGFGAAGEAGKLKIEETGQKIGQEEFGAEFGEKSRATRVGEAAQATDILGRQNIEQQRTDIQAGVADLNARIQDGRLNLDANQQQFQQKFKLRDQDFNEKMETSMFDLKDDISRGELGQGWQKMDDLRNEMNRRYGMDMDAQEFAKEMGIEDLYLKADQQQFNQWSETVDKHLEVAGLEQSDRESIRADATQRMEALLDNKVDMTKLDIEVQQMVMAAQAGDTRAKERLFMFQVDNATQRYGIDKGVSIAKLQTFAGDPIGSMLDVLSDRNLKENITPIYEPDILANLKQLDIAEWNYKADQKSIKHIGPMAQDFNELFGVGDDISIHVVDALGVALAAVKALAKKVDDLNSQIKAERGI